MKSKLMLSLCLLLAATLSWAQGNLTVTGVVTEKATGYPAIGVSVLVKGTTNGTITSFDGDFVITNVASDATLVFSYIGMVTQEVPVDGRSVINLVMAEDTQALDEVVVIGYGSAKSKDLTSPIATVSGDDLSKHISASPMQSLQGKVPGVQVINSGQPGSSPKVRIRGVGSYDDEKQGPLYVVDGMFFDNIDFLSNSDIESMNILKDASAAAIYGVRAANGVIIITTKKGALNQRPQITYDGYVGFQTASNRMKMANSGQYATMMREMGDQKFVEILNSSIEQYGGTNGVPATNTNWYDELLRTAAMHSHSININGGSENISYVVGANYLSQDGIMAVVNNGYERFNARSKVDIKLADFLKVGANLIMTNSSQDLAPETAWRYAFLSPSIYPVYDRNNTMASDEKFASPMQIGFDEYFGNPVATAYYYNHQKRNFQVLPSFYAELSFFDNKLAYRSSFNQEVRFMREREYTPAYNVSNNQKSDNSVLKKTNHYYNNYLIDNVVTYRDAIANHNFTLMAGNSVRKERYEKLYGTANDVPDGDEAYWYLMQGANDSRRAEDDGTEYRGLSWFGRLMYDYNGRYLLSATFRADGSSKYQEKWGYFPSIGLGWNITREEFMQNQRIFDYLKVRGSWGKLGNDKVEANDGFASVEQNLSTTGIFNDNPVLGVTNLGYFNYLKWEVVTEANIGFDFAVLDNRLSGEFEYYKRTTSNAVFKFPLSFGAGELLTNNGEIENSGFELTLNWSDKLPNDFSYNIGFNLSTLKNKVNYLNGLDYINTGSAEFRTVRMLGEAVDSYLGYKVIGVYQNQAQVDADPIAVKNGLKPGDFIYKDVNGDGEITDEDRVILGSALPKLTLGGNVGFEYKNFDFNLVYQAQFGNKIVNQKRGVRRWQSALNFDADMVENRWTGEGSTNKYPSAAGYINPWNIAKFNSFIVEDGSTFTIQNIQVGYTFFNLIPGAANRTSLRLSLTAERPLSFFKYNGFTTDVEDGFDITTYPLASTYSFGIKLTY